MKNVTSAISRRARIAVRWYIDSCAQLEPAAVLGMFASNVGDVRMFDDVSAQAPEPQTVDHAADHSDNGVSARRCRVAAIAAGSVAIAGAALLANLCGTPDADLLAPATSAAQVAAVQQAGITMPPRAFDQNMNASDGIRTLESEGYNVEITWGGGRTDQQLSMCRIGSVDGLRGSGAATPGTSVYVTVIC